MKRWLALCLVACARPAPPAVHVSSPDAPERAPVSRGTLLAGCTIAGAGERAGSGAPFEVFASGSAAEPVLVVTHPEKARVVWSDFPPRADDGRSRARVTLGGPGEPRYEGFSGLYGRTFTTTRRMPSVPGHLWARADASIEMMAASGDGKVWARVRTPFAAPRTIVVDGTCADVRYEPDPPPHRRMRPSRAPMMNRDAIHLFVSPDAGTPFTTIAAPEHGLDLDRLDARAGRVRVRWQGDDVGFDAWVPASEVEAGVAEALEPPPAASSTAMQRVPQPIQRTSLARAAQLFVGEDPERLAGAVIEAGTLIDWEPGSATTVDGRTFVAFDIVDGVVDAARGRLWVGAAAVK